MASPQQLSSPPISEALVDLRAIVSAQPEAFEALSRALKSDYPKSQTRRGVRAELRVEGGKLIPPTAQDLGFQGIWLRNEDETAIVQLRPDGFTFNNLKSYFGGDRLLAEALRLWTKFAEHLQPSGVSRIALKYTNQLKLPFREGDEFSRFLTAAPVTPAGAPQKVSEFLSRIVAHDSQEAATVVTTQQLTYGEPNTPLVVIDVDAFREGEFSVDAHELRSALDQLRSLKNRVFFSMLTDEAVSLFI